jgi:hypothetical protein
MALPPSDMTGAARFRRHWTGRLILQVEFDRDMDPAVTTKSMKWRDAHEHDLGTLRLIRHIRGLDPLL